MYSTRKYSTKYYLHGKLQRKTPFCVDHSLISRETRNEIFFFLRSKLSVSRVSTFEDRTTTRLRGCSIPSLAATGRLQLCRPHRTRVAANGPDMDEKLSRLNAPRARFPLLARVFKPPLGISWRATTVRPKERSSARERERQRGKKGEMEEKKKRHRVEERYIRSLLSRSLQFVGRSG